MNQIYDKIQKIRKEIQDYIENTPNPTSFGEKFRNEENQRHYKEGHFAGLCEASEIINFYESAIINFYEVVCPASIEWNQEKLKEIFDLIKKHGDNPEDYIDLHYSVSETKYNNFPEHIKNIFRPARLKSDINF